MTEAVELLTAAYDAPEALPTPTYRYLLCDLLTDRLVATLPLSGVSFERHISRVGSLSANLDAANRHQVALARAVHSMTGRAALYVLRNGQLWWGGIPWTAKASQGERGAVSLSLSAATFDSYAHHRTLRETLSYTQVDQGVIIPDLWRHLQSDPRGDIGMVAADQPTGVLRDRTFLGGELPKYGKLIEDLGDVEGGPEHTVDVFLDGNGDRVKRLRVANRLGSTTATAVFSRAKRGGGRVLSWEDTADAVDGGTTFQTRGDSAQGNVGQEKQALLSDVHEATDLLDRGWPLLDVTEDHSGVKRRATLNDHAAALRAAYAGAPVDKGYQVQVGTTGWSPNNLGDTVRLKLQDDWHQPATDTTVRPVACKVSPADRGGQESVQLIFGED